MRKPILCIDFDGVIHSYKSGWKGVHIIPDEPVPGALDALLAYIDAGYEVAIFSSRSKSLRGRRAMRRWLAQAFAQHWGSGGRSEYYNTEIECWGDAQHVDRAFKWPWFKPAAILTIDDRALTFSGTFPTVTEIRAFKPWNKK